MSTDRELDEILAEIGREHRAMGAPAQLETALCDAAAGRNRARAIAGVRLAWTLAAVVILLAAIAGGVLWQTRVSHPSQTPQARSAPVVPLKPEPIGPSTNVAERQTDQSKSASLRSIRKSHARPRDSFSRPKSWNSLDEFVPLPTSEGLPNAAELSVVRMKVRGSDLQQYGLQAPADDAGQTMLAEFVVGDDGLPRAIRILR